MAVGAGIFPEVPASRLGAVSAIHRDQPVDFTVARPGVRRTQGTLTELADRVDRLRHLAWATGGSASPSQVSGTPAIVLANLAAIGVALNRAAAQAHRTAAAAVSGPSRAVHLQAAEQAQATQLRWRDAADLIRCLRTPHAPTHPVQVERLDIHALLRQLPSAPRATAAIETAWALTRITDAYAEVAEHNAEGLALAHERGDLLLLGRAIPRDALPRRPDLLAARLHDQVINTPTLVVDRLIDLYRELATASWRHAEEGQVAPELSPPAA